MADNEIESSSSSSSNTNQSHHQNLINALQKKFILENGKTFMKSGKKGSILFLDATMSIIGKIDDPVNRRPAFYLMSVSSGNTTREIVLSNKAFTDIKSFTQGLNKEFIGGDFVFGGGVQSKDVKDYHLWIKDIFLNSDQRPSLIAAPHIGLAKPENHWILNDKQQINGTGFMMDHEKTYFVLQDDLEKYFVFINPPLISCFRTFHNSFTLIINDSDAFDTNRLSFLLLMSFLLKSYLNSYITERTDTGETKFCMIYSPEMSTGKTTSMIILSHGQGVDDESKLILSCGNAVKVGTTIKPMREVFQKTNLFVFLNDYVPNSTIDEFLLQSHEGYGQGSGESGVNKSKCSVLLTGNKPETDRLVGRVFKVPYHKSKDFSRKKLEAYESLAKANKGFLLAWCFHFAPIYYQDVVRDFDSYIEILFRKYCMDSQARYLKAWSSTITTFCLVQYSVKNPVDVSELINTAFNMVLLENCSANRFVDWDVLAKNVADEISSNKVLVSSWLNVKSSFKNKEEKTIPAIAILTTQLNRFPDINAKTLINELKESYGENACNIATEFASSENPNEKVKSKSYKIPVAKFKEEYLKLFFEATNTTLDVTSSSKIISTEEEDELISKSLAAKDAVLNVVNEKLGLPFHSFDGRFMEELSPNTRGNYSRLTIRHKSIFRDAYEAGKRRRLTMDEGS